MLEGPTLMWLQVPVETTMISLLQLSVLPEMVLWCQGQPWLSLDLSLILSSSTGHGCSLLESTQ